MLASEGEAACAGGSGSSKSSQAPERTEEGRERVRSLRYSPPQYGAMNTNGDTCPTCRGIGRIPRGQERQLVAVIPCNDVRLKPRRTKLYMCISMVVCLCLSFLILFFLFPRSVTLTPVSVLSVMVYINPTDIEMEITNLINVTNENFVAVQITDLNIQGLVNNIVMGKNKIQNMTAIPSRLSKSYTVKISLLIEDKGLYSFCRSDTFTIHTLFVELQMTMNIAYLSHTEQISQDTFEFIDCASNSTTPHPVR